MEKETQVQDLTSLLVAASALRAKWVANLKTETVDNQQKCKPSTRLYYGDAAWEKTVTSKVFRDDHVPLDVSPNIRQDKQAQASVKPIDCRRKKEIIGGYTNLDLQDSLAKRPFQLEKQHITQQPVSEPVEFTKNDTTKNHDIREKLQCAEASLLKSQSEIIRLRESNRLAKAKLCVDFDNRMKVEKGVWNEEQRLLEDELRNARADIDRLHSALAAAKNQTLMVELVSRQKLSTNILDEAPNVSRSARAVCKDGFQAQQGEDGAFQDFAQLLNELQIAHEAKNGVERELEKSKILCAELIQQHQEKSALIKILESKLNSEIIRAEMAEHAVKQAIEQKEQTRHGEVPSMTLLTLSANGLQNPKICEVQMAINHEMGLLEKLARQIQTDRILRAQTTEEFFLSFFARLANINLKDMNDKMNELAYRIIHMEAAISDLTLKLEAASEQCLGFKHTHFERSLPSENNPTGEDADEKYLLLKAEYESYKSCISKQVTGLSQEHEELHRDLSQQLTSERMEKDTLTAMLAEAKCRIKDLECELIGLISEMQESNRDTHEDYMHVEALRQECASLRKENGRLGAEISKLEGMLASRDSDHQSRRDGAGFSSLHQTSELLVSNLQYEVSKVTQDLVNENNRLTFILKDREDQLQRLKHLVLEKEVQISKLQDNSKTSAVVRVCESQNSPYIIVQNSELAERPAFERGLSVPTSEIYMQSNDLTGHSLESCATSQCSQPREVFDLVHGSLIVFPENGVLRKNWSASNYSGETLDGHPHGKGVQIWPDGRIFDGTWKHGLFEGVGTCIWWNGDIYEGDWLEGNAHGLGSYTFSCGNFYEGQFVENHFHGLGALHHRNGWRCRGSWHRGSMHGWSMIISLAGKKQILYCKQGFPEPKTFQDEKGVSEMLIQVGEMVGMARRKRQQARREQARGLKGMLHLDPMSIDALPSFDTTERPPQADGAFTACLHEPPPPPPPSPPSSARISA